MKRQSLKQILLTLIIALLTMTWAGSVSAMPPGWVGFHANLKGFPPGDQDTHIIKGQQQGKLDLDTMKVLTTSDQAAPYAPYGGFKGARNGGYPHGHNEGQ
jgi:hypothetical protein